MEKQTVTRYFRSFMSEEYLIKVPAQLVKYRIAVSTKTAIIKRRPQAEHVHSQSCAALESLLQIHIAYTFFSGVVDKTNVIILTRFTLPSSSFTFFNAPTPWRKSAFSNVATVFNDFVSIRHQGSLGFEVEVLYR